MKYNLHISTVVPEHMRGHHGGGAEGRVRHHAGRAQAQGREEE